jgi:putative transposase
MSENPFPKRKSPRLQGYDYGEEGAYFLTIVLEKHQHLFGKIEGETMMLNPAGEMIEYWWGELNRHFPNTETDLYVVMPNHLHGIFVIHEKIDRFSVSNAVQWFKTMTTNAYIRGVKQDNWKPYKQAFWQRSFHDIIIRNEANLHNSRQYIVLNPAQWAADKYYHEE